MELIIDADAHISEPPDTWVSRVPERYREDVPQMVRNDQGQDIWVMGKKLLGSVGRNAPAGWPGFPPELPQTIEDTHPGSYDAKARLAYLDEAGIWAQVLYPNIAGFGSQNFLDMPNEELKLLCVEAYNNFLQEWCSADPNRLLGVMATPFWDIEATVREVYRRAEQGFRGILFTGEPQRFDQPYIGDKYWDPLWHAAVETGLPVHFHIGGGETDIGNLVEQARIAAHGYPGTEAYAAVTLFLKNGIQCADVITSGVLNRHPELKFVSVESGAGWVPFMLEAADYSFLGAQTKGRARSKDDLLPSELFARQMYVTYWFEEVAPKYLIDALPVDNVLFETDFPHTACLYGNIQEVIDRGLGNASEEIRRKWLWENSARLYKVEPPPAAK